LAEEVLEEYPVIVVLVGVALNATLVFNEEGDIIFNTGDMRERS
jgi:hypothetical protein